jgi:signal peptidase I
MPEHAKTPDFFDRVQLLTERFLSYRRRIRRIKKEKRKGKSTIRDWLEAFLWAACMVLLVNQYLAQMYRIPSGSMIDTLNVGDHVFVNKIVYGPELLPGVLKLPSPVEPKRNEIIIFENPTYISRGPVFDIAQRLIYMLTLTLVDIDKDESGGPRVHFLIKRNAAQAGDRVVFNKGNIKLLFAGEDGWISESEYNGRRGWKHNVTRLLKDDDYSVIEAAGKAMAWADRGLPIPEEILEQARKTEYLENFDMLAREQVWLETLRTLSPGERHYAARHAKISLGWYIPEGRVFPLGDNRDSSRDGRYFGPVKMSKVLGKGMIIYWPYWRAGRIS